MTEEVTITEADWEAAFVLWNVVGSGPHMSGEWGEAFARHRIATEAAAKAREAALVERFAELEAIARDAPEYVCSGIPDSVIEAGVDAWGKAQNDMANYKPGITTDWDEGMIAAAMFRAMLTNLLTKHRSPDD